MIPPVSQLKISALEISNRAEEGWGDADVGCQRTQTANFLKQTSTPEFKAELKTWAGIGQSHGNRKQR